jgi:hypothetical protein
MPILVIFGWLVVLGCFFYLSVDAARSRLHERRARKDAARKIQDFKKDHYYDEKRRKWVRKCDGVVLPNAIDDIQGNVMLFGYLMLVLWEIFWIVEIAATPRWSQIPYLFLLVMMIGLPFAIRALWRRIQRFAVTA